MTRLKELKTRYYTLQSTRKITSAMKMVAAARTKRFQQLYETALPFWQQLAHLGKASSRYMQDLDVLPDLCRPKNASNAPHLCVVLSSDRGLCGSFNSHLLKKSQQWIQHKAAQGVPVSLWALGRKASTFFKQDTSLSIAKSCAPFWHGTFSVSWATQHLTQPLMSLFTAGEISGCTLIYNAFKSHVSYETCVLPLLPFDVAAVCSHYDTATKDPISLDTTLIEPSLQAWIDRLTYVIFEHYVGWIALESQLSEHSARMVAMEHATRNTDELLKRLQTMYNRTRQAVITRELTEIIAGAEASSM